MVAFSVIALVYLIALVRKKVKERNPRIEIICLDSNNEYLVVLLLIVLLDSQLTEALAFSLEPFLEIRDIKSYVLILLQNVLITQTLFAILLFMADKAMKALVHKKADFYLTVMTSLMLSLLLNFGMQFTVRGDINLFEKFIFPAVTLYQLLFFFTIFQFIYFIVNRFVQTTLLLCAISSIMVMANHIKFAMRSEPILITDLIWLKELSTLISFTSPEIVLVIFAIMITYIISYLYLRSYFQNKPIVHLRWRILGSLCLLTLMSANFYVFSKEKAKEISPGIPIISTLNNWNDIAWMGFKANAQLKSVSYVWTKQMTKSIMEKPEGYSSESTKQIALKYSELAKQINQNRSKNINDQTVIFILSETLSNPSRLDGVHLSRDVLPHIDQIKAQTTSGTMRTKFYGGGTANLEFQSLTGLPYHHYSPSVSTLYTEVVPKMRVFPSISSQFNSENRIVIHPSSAGNYSRHSIYRTLDFSKQIFLEGSSETLTNPKFVGVSMSDETVYNNILERIADDKSQFFSVITMQNHSPWLVGEPSDVIASGENFSDS